MIKLIVARYENDDNIYNEYIAKSIDNLDVDVFHTYGNEGLAEKYNAAIDKIIKTDLHDNDVLCFVHSDVIIVDQYFIEKVNLIFEKRNDIGILGVIGCTEFNNTGMWWANTPENLRGHIIQSTKGGKDIHLVKGNIGFFDNMVTVDGLIMMFNAKMINEGFRFDQNTFTKFDFYDIDACFQALQMGYKVAISDILVQHKSIGEGVFGDGWKTGRTKFFEKWKDLQFPYKVKG